MHVNPDFVRKLPYGRKAVSLPQRIRRNPYDDLIAQLNIQRFLAVKINFQYHTLTVFRFLSAPFLLRRADFKILLLHLLYSHSNKFPHFRQVPIPGGRRLPPRPVRRAAFYDRFHEPGHIVHLFLHICPALFLLISGKQSRENQFLILLFLLRDPG